MLGKSPELQSAVMDKTGHFDTRSLLSSVISGQDPEQATYGRSGVLAPSSDDSFSGADEDSSSPLDKFASESDSEGDGSKDIQESAASSGSETGEPENGEPSSLDNLASKNPETGKVDIETITLKMKDEQGRPQKLKVDYTDREAIKKAYIQAAGMRKFQNERDTARKELADIQAKHTELNQVYSVLDAAFKKDGVKGVVNLLGQGQNPWAEAVDAELKHRNYIAGLTPAEKYQLDMEEKAKVYEQQLAAEKGKREEFERKMAEKEEQTALKSLESRLHPAFDRYRFAGKLSDPVVEHQFDEAIWNKVTAQLAEYPDDMELTAAVIDKEFRTVANNFRKMLNTQSEKAVKATIEKKKVEAGERAQVAAKKGLSGNADSRKFVEDVKSGNIRDAFSAMFSGKVKL